MEHTRLSDALSQGDCSILYSSSEHIGVQHPVRVLNLHTVTPLMLPVSGFRPWVFWSVQRHKDRQRSCIQRVHEEKSLRPKTGQNYAWTTAPRNSNAKYLQISTCPNTQGSRKWSEKHNRRKRRDQPLDWISCQRPSPSNIESERIGHPCHK